MSHKEPIDYKALMHESQTYLDDVIRLETQADEDHKRLIEHIQSRALELVADQDDWFESHEVSVRKSDISIVEPVDGTLIIHMKSGICIMEGIVYPNAKAVSNCRLSAWREAVKHGGKLSKWHSDHFPRGLCSYPDEPAYKEKEQS